MAIAGTTQKCMACDKTVYLVDWLMADNRIYHKACFRCHHCRGTLKNANANRVSNLFASTRDKCVGCNKTVYPIEKVTVNGTAYHGSCFKCTHGSCTISPSSYIAHEGRLLQASPHSNLQREAITASLRVNSKWSLQKSLPNQ